MTWVYIISGWLLIGFLLAVPVGRFLSLSDRELDREDAIAQIHREMERAI